MRPTASAAGTEICVQMKCDSLDGLPTEARCCIEEYQDACRDNDVERMLDCLVVPLHVRLDGKHQLLVSEADARLFLWEILNGLAHDGRCVSYKLRSASRTTGGMTFVDTAFRKASMTGSRLIDYHVGYAIIETEEVSKIATMVIERAESTLH